MSPLTVLVGDLWGFATADPTLVGIVVAVVSALALVYVLTRLFAARRPPHRGD